MLALYGRDAVSRSIISAERKRARAEEDSQVMPDFRAPAPTRVHAEKKEATTASSSGCGAASPTRVHVKKKGAELSQGRQNLRPSPTRVREKKGKTKHA